MTLEEDYKPVGYHFGDGYNMEIFEINTFFSFLGAYVYMFRMMALVVILETPFFPLVVQVLKHKNGWMRFWMMVPEAVFACP